MLENGSEQPRCWKNEKLFPLPSDKYYKPVYLAPAVEGLGGNTSKCKAQKCNSSYGHEIV